MGCCMSGTAAVQDSQRSVAEGANNTRLWGAGVSGWDSTSGDHLQPNEPELNSQTESVGRTDRGDVGTNTEVHSEALSASSTGAPDMDEGQSQADYWSVLNDEIHVSGVQSSVCGTGLDGLDDDAESEQQLEIHTFLNAEQAMKPADPGDDGKKSC